MVVPVIDVELLARCMPTHTEPPDWGSDMHMNRLYGFGSIHDKRCIPAARAIAAKYDQLTIEESPP